MNAIRYVKGDATCPLAKGPKIICHVCNDLGGWGKAVSKRWEEPEAEYRAWHRSGEKSGFELGAVQFVQVEDHIWVANIIGQRGMKRGSSGPPIRYEAIAKCLEQVAVKAKELEATVHMPRIGCGLAGGEWSEIEPIIERSLLSAGVQVTVYDFE